MATDHQRLSNLESQFHEQTTTIQQLQIQLQELVFTLQQGFDEKLEQMMRGFDALLSARLKSPQTTTDPYNFGLDSEEIEAAADGSKGNGDVQKVFDKRSTRGMPHRKVLITGYTQDEDCLYVETFEYEQKKLLICGFSQTEDCWCIETYEDASKKNLCELPKEDNKNMADGVLEEFFNNSNNTLTFYPDGETFRGLNNGNILVMNKENIGVLNNGETQGSPDESNSILTTGKGRHMMILEGQSAWLFPFHKLGASILNVGKITQEDKVHKKVIKEGIVYYEAMYKVFDELFKEDHMAYAFVVIESAKTCIQHAYCSSKITSGMLEEDLKYGRKKLLSFDPGGGGDNQGQTVVATTYLKICIGKNIDASKVSKEYCNAFMRALLLKVLVEGFRVMVVAKFVKDNLWPELQSVIHNSNLIIGTGNGEWKTVNALMVLQSLIRSFQYFLNPKVAREPIPIS